MKPFNNTKNCLSNSSSSSGANSNQNEKNNLNYNLNYPFFLNKSDSDSFDDDEDGFKEKEEASLKSKGSITKNQIVNEDEDKIDKQFVEEKLFNLIGGSSNANDLNIGLLLEKFKFHPEEKMWCVTNLNNGFTQDFSALELFEFLCDKIEKNLNLDNYKVYHKDFIKIPKFKTIELFNILSEFLGDYYKSSLSAMENHNININPDLQNNNQFNQINQNHNNNQNNNHNQNNNNNYNAINNWIHTNFNICNNSDNNF